MASSSSARYAKHRRIGEDEEAEEDEEEAEEEAEEEVHSFRFLHALAIRLFPIFLPIVFDLVLSLRDDGDWFSSVLTRLIA